jgi:hypothetical protein
MSEAFRPPPGQLNKRRNVTVQLELSPFVCQLTAASADRLGLGKTVFAGCRFPLSAPPASPSAVFLMRASHARRLERETRSIARSDNPTIAGNEI